MRQSSKNAATLPFLQKVPKAVWKAFYQAFIEDTKKRGESLGEKFMPKDLREERMLQDSVCLLHYYYWCFERWGGLGNGTGRVSGAPTKRK